MLLAVALLHLQVAICNLQSAISQVQQPELAIESFSASKGYAAGSDSIQLIGTVRNTGSIRLDEGAAQARMYLLAGLEYDQGDTSPKLPTLEPGGAVTFRWKVAPSSERGGLVASFVLQVQGKEPIVRIASIPHIVAAPRNDNPPPIRGARARAGDYPAIENDRIRARIVQTDAEMPVLFFSTRSPAGWRSAGISVPLAEVMSGEGGQIPWWEVFKLDDSRALNAADSSTLSLSGRFGIRWRATIDLVTRPLSSVLEIRLRLSPTRPMRLYGLRIAPLLAGDGASDDTLMPHIAGGSELTALFWSDITAGALRPVEPLFPGWSNTAQPIVEGADFRLLAAESKAGERGALLETGTMVQTATRLFALAPSTNVQDALKIIRPPGPPTPPALTRGVNAHRTAARPIRRSTIQVRRRSPVVKRHGRRVGPGGPKHRIPRRVRRR